MMIEWQEFRRLNVVDLLESQILLSINNHSTVELTSPFPLTQSPSSTKSSAKLISARSGIFNLGLDLDGRGRLSEGNHDFWLGSSFHFNSRFNQGTGSGWMRINKKYNCPTSISSVAHAYLHSISFPHQILPVPPIWLGNEWRVKGRGHRKWKRKSFVTAGKTCTTSSPTPKGGREGRCRPGPLMRSLKSTVKSLPDPTFNLDFMWISWRPAVTTPAKRILNGEKILPLPDPR